MKKALLLTFFLANTFSILSQRCDWVDYGASSNPSPYNNAVATDDWGNVYSFHVYNTNVIVQGDTVQPVAGQDECILVKYDSTGVALWWKTIGGTWFDDIYKVAADASGHVYLSCAVQNTTIMNDTSYASTSWYQVIQLDSSGNHLRTKFISGFGKAAMATLGDYVYVAYDNILEKLDTNLNIVWSRSGTLGAMTFYSTGDLYTTPGGRLVACGAEGDGSTATFDTITLNFTPGGFNEVFVISMDTSGNALWGRTLYPASSVAEGSQACAGDDAGNVYLQVHTTSQIIFGGDTLDNPLTAGANYEALLKFDNTGQEIWASGLYPVANALIYDLLVNAEGDILMAGSYVNGNAVYEQFNLTAPSGAVVIKTDSSGTALWVKQDVGMVNTSKHFKGLAPLGDGYAAAGFFSTDFQLDCFDASPAIMGFFTTYITENPVVEAAFGYDVLAAFTIDFTDQSTGATSWQWDFGDGDTSTLQNPSHTYASAGNYTVTLVASDGICTDSATVMFVNVGLPEFPVQSSWTVFPNPVRDVLNIEGPAADCITLFNPIGSEILRIKPGSQLVRLPVQHLAAGIYFVRIESGVTKVVRKWVKDQD